MNAGNGLTVDIIADEPRWQQRLDDIETLARRAATATWRAAGPGGAAEVSVVLLDDARQQALNRDWRGLDNPTNVLSFAASGGPAPVDAPCLLGDITLALETVEREAREQEKPLTDHFSHLVVHGMLHLVGFDHETETDAATMEGLEREILKNLGIEDPYSSRPA